MLLIYYWWILLQLPPVDGYTTWFFATACGLLCFEFGRWLDGRFCWEGLWQCEFERLVCWLFGLHWDSFFMCCWMLLVWSLFTRYILVQQDDIMLLSNFCFCFLCRAISSPPTSIRGASGALHFACKLECLWCQGITYHFPIYGEGTSLHFLSCFMPLFWFSWWRF